MTRPKLNVILKLAKKFEIKLSHQVNNNWHTDWHRHPMGTYYAEQYNGDRKPDGSPDI